MDITGRVGEWTKSTELTEKENLNLPVPRLEIRYFNYEFEDNYNLVAVYSLIYKHFLGEITSLPFGYTRAGYPSKTPINEDGTLQLPFRDGAHIKNEMEQLKLPAYVIYNEQYQVIENDEEKESESI